MGNTVQREFCTPVGHNQLRPSEKFCTKRYGDVPFVCIDSFKQLECAAKFPEVYLKKDKFKICPGSVIEFPSSTEEDTILKTKYEDTIQLYLVLPEKSKIECLGSECDCQFIRNIALDRVLSYPCPFLEGQSDSFEKLDVKGIEFLSEVKGFANTARRNIFSITNTNFNIPDIKIKTDIKETKKCGGESSGKGKGSDSRRLSERKKSSRRRDLLRGKVVDGDEEILQMLDDNNAETLDSIRELLEEDQAEGDIVAEEDEVTFCSDPFFEDEEEDFESSTEFLDFMNATETFSNATEPVQTDDLRAVLQSFDVNLDKKISCEEFIAGMQFVDPNLETCAVFVTYFGVTDPEIWKAANKWAELF